MDARRCEMGRGRNGAGKLAHDLEHRNEIENNNVIIDVENNSDYPGQEPGPGKLGACA